MTNIASRFRHSGARNFQLGKDVDFQVSYLVLSTITDRYNIPLPMRKTRMEVFIISTNTYYKLVSLGRGTNEGDDEQYWEERILEDYQLSVAKGQPDGYPPLDSSGTIPAQYLSNVFINSTEVVADVSQRLNLIITTGVLVIQEDNGSAWLKLNDNNPSAPSDFTLLSPSGNVISVNGQSGVVILDLDAVLAYGNSTNQFNIALSTSSYGLQTATAISELQAALIDLDYYTRAEVNALLATIEAGGGFGIIESEFFEYTSTNTFTLSEPPIGVFTVTLRGIQLTPTLDFTISGSDITLLDTLSADDEIIVNYYYNLTFPEILDLFYTQAQIDAFFAAIPDSYTKTESDAKYELKNVAYTKSASDAKYELIGTAYTKSESAALFAMPTITTQSSNYTAEANDHVLMTTGATDKTVTLPAASANATVLVTKMDAGAGDVIIDGNASETINGTLTVTIENQYDTLTFKCTGSEWIII